MDRITLITLLYQQWMEATEGGQPAPEVNTDIIYLMGAIAKGTSIAVVRGGPVDTFLRALPAFPELDRRRLICWES